MAKALDSYGVYRDPPAIQVFRIAKSHGMYACCERWHWLSPKKLQYLHSLGRSVAEGKLSQADLDEDARIVDLVKNDGGLAAAIAGGLDEVRIRVAFARSDERIPRGMAPRVSDRVLREAFANGESGLSVSKRLGLARATVYQRWEGLGLDRHARAAEHRREVDRLAREASQRLREARDSALPIAIPDKNTLAVAIAGGASQQDIAHRAGLPKHIITREIRRHKLPRPRTQEPPRHA